MQDSQLSTETVNKYNFFNGVSEFIFAISRSLPASWANTSEFTGFMQTMGTLGALASGNGNISNEQVSDLIAGVQSKFGSFNDFAQRANTVAIANIQAYAQSSPSDVSIEGVTLNKSGTAPESVDVQKFANDVSQTIVNGIGSVGSQVAAVFNNQPVDFSQQWPDTDYSSFKPSTPENNASGSWENSGVGGVINPDTTPANDSPNSNVDTAPNSGMNFSTFSPTDNNTNSAWDGSTSSSYATPPTSDGNTNQWDNSGSTIQEPQLPDENGYLPDPQVANENGYLPNNQLNTYTDGNGGLSYMTTGSGGPSIGSTTTTPAGNPFGGTAFPINPEPPFIGPQVPETPSAPLEPSITGDDWDKLPINNSPAPADTYTPASETDLGIAISNAENFLASMEEQIQKHMAGSPGMTREEAERRATIDWNNFTRAQSAAPGTFVSDEDMVINAINTGDPAKDEKLRQMALDYLHQYNDPTTSVSLAQRDWDNGVGAEFDAQQNAASQQSAADNQATVDAQSGAGQYAPSDQDYINSAFNTGSPDLDAGLRENAMKFLQDGESVTSAIDHANRDWNNFINAQKQAEVDAQLGAGVITDQDFINSAFNTGNAQVDANLRKMATDYMAKGESVGAAIDHANKDWDTFVAWEAMKNGSGTPDPSADEAMPATTPPADNPEPLPWG